MFANMGGWSFVLILVIILLLFGAPRLPQLAKSLGQSMRIFKGEMKTMKDEKKTDGTAQSEADPNPGQITGQNSAADANDHTLPDSRSDGGDNTAR